MVQQHFAEIDAEYCLAEGGSVLRSGGQRALRVGADGGKDPARDPADRDRRRRSRLGAARDQRDPQACRRRSRRSATWKPPIQLNETTRTYFTRLAAISPPAEAARYRAVIGTDPKAAQDAVDYFAKNEPRLASMLRSSISPTIIQGGYRVNVIPSEAKATLDVRLHVGPGSGGVSRMRFARSSTIRPSASSGSSATCARRRRARGSIPKCSRCSSRRSRGTTTRPCCRR